MTATASDDSRIRVLTLTRDLAVTVGSGGAERIAYEFAMRLDPTRFSSYVGLTRAPEPERVGATDEDIARLRSAGVQVLRLERHHSLTVRPWLRLYRFLRHESIDIIHAHMPRVSVPATIIGRLAGVPVIVNQEHGWSFEGKRLRRFLDRHVVARGDVMLAVSQHDRRQIIDVEGIAPERIRVLPNGIDSTPAAGLDIRAELGADQGMALVGAVGRLVPEKGHADLVRAISLLRSESRNVKCVIAGDGPEDRRLSELIRELNVRDSVQLLGARDDVNEVLHALDVAVLCSKHEGSPLALMEYMAAGAPIVATAVGGVPEMIEDSVHGLLVRPADPAALASAIRRLLDDQELARRLASQARQRQRSEFDLAVVVIRLEELYLELFDSADRRGREPACAGDDRPSVDQERSNSGNVRVTTDCHV